MKTDVRGWLIAGALTAAIGGLIYLSQQSPVAAAPIIPSPGSSRADNAQLSAVAPPIVGSNNGWTGGGAGVLTSQANGLAISGQTPAE
jgi:hypothetical protein